MKYSVFFVLLLLSSNLQADDYSTGCGLKLDSHQSDLLSRTAIEKDASIFGINCQFVVSTSPQSGKWLPSAPSVSFKALDNEFFNTYREQSNQTEFNLQWPIYRGSTYEVGFDYAYQNIEIPFTLKKQNLNWVSNQPLERQQTFNSTYFSTNAYVIFQKSKLINEVGLGVSRYKKTGEIYNPKGSADYLADIDAYEWFIYTEHKPQGIGWGFPFRFSLHKGQHWNDQKKSQELDAQIAGMDVSFGISYAYRINYYWTLKADAAQKAQLRFTLIPREAHYYKSWLSSQQSAGISIYYHF